MGRMRVRAVRPERAATATVPLPGGSPVSDGFTLVELLVVVAVIAVLLAIMLPALGRVREQARRIQCASNVRQHLLGLHAYGNENSGRLPTGQPLPATADIECTTVNFLLRSGLTRDMFYCPSNLTHRKYRDHCWIEGYPDANRGGWDGTRFTTVGQGRVFSDYSWLFFDGGRSSVNAFEVTPYLSDTTPKTWVRTLQDKAPATKELVVDRIEGTYAPNVERIAATTSTKYKLSFIEGNAPPVGIPQRCANHLHGLDPTGSNIGFLDGHTEWRRFNPDIGADGVAVARCWSSPKMHTYGWFW